MTSIEPELKLFAHSQDDIETCADAIGGFETERAGLYCEVAQPVADEDRVRTGQEVLWDL